MDNKNVSFVAHNFECKKCDYKSNKINDYNRHLQSKKHKDNKNNENVAFVAPFSDFNCVFCSYKPHINIFMNVISRVKNIYKIKKYILIT